MHKLFPSWKLADGTRGHSCPHPTSKQPLQGWTCNYGTNIRTTLNIHKWNYLSLPPRQDFGDLFHLYGLVTVYTQAFWRKVKRTNLGLNYTNPRRAAGSCSAEYSAQLARWQHWEDPSKFSWLMHRLVFPGICTSLVAWSICSSAKCSNHRSAHSKNTAPLSTGTVINVPSATMSFWRRWKEEKHLSVVKEDTLARDPI